MKKVSIFLKNRKLILSVLLLLLVVAGSVYYLVFYSKYSADVTSNLVPLSGMNKGEMTMTVNVTNLPSNGSDVKFKMYYRNNSSLVNEDFSLVDHTGSVYQLMLVVCENPTTKKLWYCTFAPDTINNFPDKAVWYSIATITATIVDSSGNAISNTLDIIKDAGNCGDVIPPRIGSVVVPSSCPDKTFSPNFTLTNPPPGGGTPPGSGTVVQPPPAAVDVGIKIPGSNKTSYNFNSYISAILKYSIRLGFALAVLMLIYAGIKYMTSQGNQTALNDAKEIMLGAIIGFVILLLVNVILIFLGVK